MQASCMGWVDSHGDPSQAVPAAQRFWLAGGGGHVKGVFSKTFLSSLHMLARSELHAPLRFPLSDSISNWLFAPAQPSSTHVTDRFQVLAYS